MFLVDLTLFLGYKIEVIYWVKVSKSRLTKETVILGYVLMYYIG